MATSPSTAKAWLLPLLGCTVVGALVGAALGLTRSDDEATSGATIPREVAESGDVDARLVAYRCPAEGEVATFVSGDRVYATGRDASGAWLEVRDPLALEARVWVEIAAVEPDRSFDGLPEHDCTWPRLPDFFEVAGPPPEGDRGPETEPGPAPPEPDPDATTPEPEPREPPEPPEPAPDPGPDPAPEPPTPTTAPDMDPPVIHAVVAEPSDIWETGCIDPVSVVRAHVTDDEGVAQVRLSWSVGDATGSVRMWSEGADHVGEVGWFPPRTVNVHGPGVEAVLLTIDATDHAGNMATATVTDQLELHLCD